MRLPDLLATRTGRLAAFFLLYVTEGVPLGFTATAIATQMRRQGLGPAAIGAFVGSLYLLTRADVADIPRAGDTATSRAICFNPMVMGGEAAQIYFVGIWYVDEFVRTEQGWRMSKRVEEKCFYKLL